MTLEISCARKNGNGNGNGNHETGKTKPQALPKELEWHIRRDMPRPGQKEPRKKPTP